MSRLGAKRSRQARRRPGRSDTVSGRLLVSPPFAPSALTLSILPACLCLLRYSIARSRVASPTLSTDSWRACVCVASAQCGSMWQMSHSHGVVVCGDRAFVIFFFTVQATKVIFPSTLPFTCQPKVPDISSYKLPPGINHRDIISIFFKKEGNNTTKISQLSALMKRAMAQIIQLFFL